MQRLYQNEQVLEKHTKIYLGRNCKHVQRYQEEGSYVQLALEYIYLDYCLLKTLIVSSLVHIIITPFWSINILPSLTHQSHFWKFRFTISVWIDNSVSFFWGSTKFEIQKLVIYRILNSRKPWNFFYEKSFSNVWPYSRSYSKSLIR